MSTYSRDTTAISELTGQPVNTWSEEWQRECEARAILKMSKVQREEFFNGKKDENGKTLERGIVALRGPEAVGFCRKLGFYLSILAISRWPAAVESTV